MDEIRRKCAKCREKWVSFGRDTCDTCLEIEAVRVEAELKRLGLSRESPMTIVAEKWKRKL